MDSGAFRLGVIGHRHLGDEATRGYVQHCCTRALAVARERHAELVAVSALADGADSVFAQAALSLGVPLELVTPHLRLSGDTWTGVNRDQYRALRARAVRESVTHFDRESPQAYRRSMQWVVIKSHVLVVVWDGKERGSTGGTWETVALARQLGKPMIHIDNVRHRVQIGEHPLPLERALEQFW